MKENYIQAYIWRNSKYIFLGASLVVIGLMLTTGGHISPGLNVQSDYDAVLRFLHEDTTDTNPYLGDDIYDCEDFAMDTQLRAKQHGLSCAYVLITARTNDSHYHAIIAFRVDDKTIFFEPQSDTQMYPLSEDIYSITWDAGQYSTRDNKVIE